MSSCFSPVILSRAAKLQAQQLSSSIGPRGSGWSPQEQPQQHLATQGWKVQQQAGRRYRHNSCPQALGREAAAGPHRSSHSNTWQHRDGRYSNRQGEGTGTTVVLKHWAERQRLVPTGAATATPGNTGMEGTATGREKVQAQQLSSSIGPRGSGWSPQEQPQQHLATQGWKVQQQAGRRYRHNSCPQALGREAAAGPHRNSHSNTWQHRDGRYSNRHGEGTGPLEVHIPKTWQHRDGRYNNIRQGEGTGTTVVLKHWAERQRLVPTGTATATPGNTGMEGTTTSGREKVQGHWKYTSPKPGNTGMEGTTSGREKVQGHWKYTSPKPGNTGMEGTTTSGREKVQGHWKYTSPKPGNKKTYLYDDTGLQCWDTMCTCGKRMKPAAYQTEYANEPLHMK